MSTIWIGLLVYLLFVISRFLFRFYKKYVFFDSLPGYSKKEKHWLKGNLHIYATNNTIDTKAINDLVKRFPRFYRVWLGPIQPIIEVVHPETVKIILKTAEPKPIGIGGGYSFMKPWLGEGLLLAGGEKWARSRRLLTPAFHFDILKPYQNINNQCTDVLLGILDKYAESGESFELFQLISNCSLDIILQCAFSYKTQCQTEREQHPYCKAINETTDNLLNRYTNPMYTFDTLWFHSELGKKNKKTVDYIHKVADEVIQNRQKVLKEGSVESKKHLDFLDILLTAKDETGKGMSHLEIRNEVDTFLFEGHDTTTSAISWVLHELALHPSYQRQCQDEIDAVLGDKPGFIKWNDLSQLPFLTQCIKEGMRLHSPVPFIARETTKEFNIDGNTIPEGSTININIYGLHHNSTVWKDPMKFDPSRFSRENSDVMDSYAFVPFSAGPRNCIGQHFAMNEEKTMIARILERFTIELDPDHKVEYHMSGVMKTKNGIRCFVKRRK